jgi:hypothetical protein
VSTYWYIPVIIIYFFILQIVNLEGQTSTPIIADDCRNRELEEANAALPVSVC